MFIKYRKDVIFHFTSHNMYTIIQVNILFLRTVKSEIETLSEGDVEW